MRKLLVEAHFLVLVLAVFACAPANPSPDIVLFVIDTLRADRLGAYGYEPDTTPRIDNLARHAVTFEQAYSTAPWTLPSVVSMMTSQFPCEHGVVVDGRQVSAATLTLAERLANLGYRTGSFHGNPYAGEISGLDRGFETVVSQRSTDGKDLRDWLRRSPRQPIFLYVHNVEPHSPFSSPAMLARRFGTSPESGREANKLFRQLRGLTRFDFSRGRTPGTEDNSDEQTALMDQLEGMAGEVDALYDAEVRLADNRLGTVIDSLRNRGRWKNTLFVVASDHGEEFGEHGGWQHDQSVYDELLRVPLLIRFPAALHGGRRISTPVSLVDLVPTVLDILGAPSAIGTRGRSLLPLIEGTVVESGPRAVGMRDNRKKYFRPFHESRGNLNVALRQGRWKAIWNADLESLELYDLRTDAGETLNLAERYPEEAAQLAAAADSWLGFCGDPAAAVPQVEAIDEDAIERLRALGYVD